MIPRALKTGISLALRLVSRDAKSISTYWLISKISSARPLSSSEVLYATIFGLCFITSKTSSPPLTRFSIISLENISIFLSSIRINALLMASVCAFSVPKNYFLLLQVCWIKDFNKRVNSDLMTLCKCFLQPCLIISRKVSNCAWSSQKE